jgi:hypothetical protein
VGRALSVNPAQKEINARSGLGLPCRRGVCPARVNIHSLRVLVNQYMMQMYYFPNLIGPELRRPPPFLLPSGSLSFRELGVPEACSPTPLHYYCKILCILIQGVDNSDQAPLPALRYLNTDPDIHQGEKIYGRLLPSVLRVSEKNSSRILGEQGSPAGEPTSSVLRPPW